MQGFSKEHESSFGDKNIMKKRGDLLTEIYREVGEIHAKVDELRGMKEDVDSLKASRNKVYGILSLGLLASFWANLKLLAKAFGPFQ
jgi:hypothetical protein